MLYNSTENKNEVVSASQAIAQGISKDGGLFVPQSLPEYDTDVLQSEGVHRFPFGLHR